MDGESRSQQQALLAVFDDRVAVYQRELLRCLQVPGEDAVHDLRVSIRRLLALLALLQRVAPSLRRRKKLRRRLKRQLAEMGALRDTQVALALVKALGKPLAGKQLFCAYLLKREYKQLHDSRHSLQRFPVDKVCRQLDKLRKQLRKQSLKLTGQGLSNAVEAAYAEVLVCHRRAQGENDAASVHRVRVAFKRFRYTVEIVQLLVPVFPAKTLHAIRQYQTLLGNVQDARVLLARLERFAARAEVVTVAPLLHHFQRQYSLQVARYWQRREQLAGFRLPANGVPSV